MNWTDIDEIAIALSEKYPDVDPRYVRFTDLHRWILQLEGFVGEPDRGGERILEAVQAAWTEEVAD